MYATAEGTARYAARFPEFQEAAFFRSVFNLSVSSLGIGTYLGDANDAADARYTDALIAAGESVIRWYGAATWDGFRKRAMHLPRVAELATEAGGADHHFRFVQLPFNLGMIEAYDDRPESVLEMAARLGIAVVASATLMQTRAI